MTPAISILFVLVLLCDIRLLAGSRLAALIQNVAVQGAALALLPLFLPRAGLPLLHLQALAVGVVLIKGWLIPRLLRRALRETNTRRELDPLVGYNSSLLIGVGMLVFSIWLGSVLVLPGPSAPPPLVPVGVFTLLSGLFLVMARRQALTQVVGYLVFENGIYAFGLAVLHEEPALVEMGALLDLVVGILVMSLIVFRLERDLGHSDAGRLQRLRG